MGSIEIVSNCTSFHKKFKIYPNIKLSDDEIEKLIDDMNQLATEDKLWIDCSGDDIDPRTDVRLIGAKVKEISKEPIKFALNMCGRQIAYWNIWYGVPITIVVEDDVKIEEGLLKRNIIFKKLTVYDCRFDEQNWSRK